MLNPQERITSGLNSLTKSTRKHLALLQVRRVRGKAKSSSRRPRLSKNISITELVNKPQYQQAPLDLKNTLEKVGVFSPYSLVLGKCDDDLPLLLELSNPAPGSIMISGDQGSGKTRLVHAIVESGSILNSREHFQFHIIASEPGKYSALSHHEGCQQVLAVDNDQPKKCIEKLAELVERRQRLGPSDPAIVLIIDDLSTLSDSMDYEQALHLLRVIKHGPRSWIWTIAIIPSDRLGSVHEKILTGFRTRLIGKISSTILAAALTGEDYSPVTDLDSGSQFCVPVKDNWILFRILA